MTQDDGASAPETLEAAQAIIEQQAAEIARLRRRLDDDLLVRDLRDAVRLSVTAGAIAAPATHSRLLDMIVATAADIIGANAGALFLIDREQEDLVFEVALGEKADEVKKFRVPLGHGVAGLVALTGQPMAVSDTQSDDRDAADIAEAVGYVPKNILCVPLFYSDQVIGVLELLDKEGAAHFSPDDMEALGLFANQAAVAIEQSRNHGRLEALVAGFVQSLGGSRSTSARVSPSGPPPSPATSRTTPCISSRSTSPCLSRRSLGRENVSTKRAGASWKVSPRFCAHGRRRWARWG